MNFLNIVNQLISEEREKKNNSLGAVGTIATNSGQFATPNLGKSAGVLAPDFSSPQNLKAFNQTIEKQNAKEHHHRHRSENDDDRPDKHCSRTVKVQNRKTITNRPSRTHRSSKSRKTQTKLKKYYH